MENCPILFFGIEPKRIVHVSGRFPNNRVLQCGELDYNGCLEHYEVTPEDVGRVIIDRRTDWRQIAGAARAGNPQSWVAVAVTNSYERNCADDWAVRQSINRVCSNLNDI